MENIENIENIEYENIENENIENTENIEYIDTNNENIENNYETELEELQERVADLCEEIPATANKNFLRYFLKSNGNIEDALQMILNYAEWRRENDIGVLCYDDVSKQLDTGKINIMQNENPTCDLLIVFVSRLHYPRDSPTIDFTRSIIFLLEFYMCEEHEYNGFVILNDMRSVGKSNFDFKFTHAIRGLQTCLPVLPHKILIYQPPLLFKFVWKIVRPLLTPEVHSLIQVVKSPTEIMQYIHPDNLWQEYGGNLIEDKFSWLEKLSQEYNTEEDNNNVGDANM